MSPFQVSVSVCPPGRTPQHAEFGCATAEEATTLRDWLLEGNGVAVKAYAPHIVDVMFDEPRQGRRQKMVDSREVQQYRELD